MKPLIPFAPCRPDPFCPTPIFFKNIVPVLSIDGCMSSVPSHCLTITLTNKDHQSFNFILHYFIGKTAFFSDENITIWTP